jgi:hypothetical protein
MLGGRTVVRSQALRRIVAALVAELAGVSSRAVRTRLADSRGALTVSIASPLSVVGMRVAGTVVEQATLIAETVSSRLDMLTGRSVSRVDVRFFELRRPQAGRVR